MKTVKAYKLNIGKGFEIHSATEKQFGFDTEIVSTSKLVHYDSETGEALFKIDGVVTLEQFKRYDVISTPILNK